MMQNWIIVHLLPESRASRLGGYSMPSAGYSHRTAEKCKAMGPALNALGGERSGDTPKVPWPTAEPNPPEPSPGTSSRCQNFPPRERLVLVDPPRSWAAK